MLPEPPCSGCVALGHGRVRVYSSKDPMQCGAAALVKQLDVSLGSQQRLDASLLPFGVVMPSTFCRLGLAECCRRRRRMEVWP